MMKFHQLKTGLILLLIGTTFTVSAQKELYANSIKAYESKDFKAFLKITKSLDSIRPNHPTFTYNLAAAFALNGMDNESIVVLKKLVLMNNTTAFEKDADFSSLQNLPEYKELLILKENQNREVAHSEKVVTLSEKLLHPEGLVYLPKRKIWLAASIRLKKIVAFNSQTGTCTDWLSNDSLLSVFAMKPDADENFLWVATSAMPQMEGFFKALEGKAEILKVNIKTKQIVARYTIPGNHVFGDILILKDNRILISDSASPILYTIENNTIVPWLSFEKDGFNLQGICTNESNSKLYVADYLKGIAVVDIQSKSKTWLSFPDGTSNKGIDGLLFFKNRLIAIQNGVQPIRITQFNLNTKQNSLIGYSIIDQNRPEFNEPALATIVENRLYFFANAPWQAYDTNNVLNESKVNNPVLYSCDLK